MPTEPGQTDERMQVRLERWGPGDRALLDRITGDPAMMEHLGGPESPEKISARQARYERMQKGTYRIVDRATGQSAGWVGYWERSWRGEEAYETGWAVLPELQGRGIASAATSLVIAAAAAEGRHRFMHAFPSVTNPPSNAICRKLGFVLLGELDFEYPPGSTMRCNDWRLDLG